MQTVDYIIIGAGSAGCLLANRLSANPAQQVLLLEAGGKDDHSNIHTPASFGKLFRSEVDWNIDTIPQKHMNQRAMYQPRGKVLGGSSSINAMIYIRGHRYDYDNWAAMGNTGWSYEEVLPFFRKFEQNLHKADAFHGSEGELIVTDPRSPNILSHKLVEAAQQAGYPINDDFNGAKQEGFGLYQLTQNKGKRCSAAVAFLHPVMHRPNLSVKTNALVHRIDIQEQKAVSVTFEQGGKQQQIRANKEIILCAGAFGSPHLLMLSGIGDAAQLRQHQIEVMHHSPEVGQNLQDHLLGGISFESKKRITLDTIENFPAILAHLTRYFLNKKGPLTSNVAEAGGFLKTDKSLPAPDIQFHFAPAYYLRHGFENPAGSGFSLGTTLIAPESRGHIQLASNRPEELPLIDPNYFAAESDIRVMLKGCYIAMDILSQPAFAPYRGAIRVPDQQNLPEEDMIAFLREYVETLYHPVGTCRMGTDQNAVVDEQLRVRGVEQLRVADASIMPTIVRGNTNAPTMMIAEKAAAFILDAEQQTSKKQSIQA
ncbi:MAG: choline dehydrogenase [Saprospiraceae bacterium]|nr:choline dehydrogenase [Saprospiraceae bacterium]